jgi:hypothetical protein
MGSFGKSHGGGRRKSERAQVPQLGTLSTLVNDYRVGLVNVSSTGAQFSGPHLPAQGEDVIFQAHKVQSFGRVAWSQDGQCGVAFESPITGAEVAHLHQAANISSLAGWSSGPTVPAEEAGCGTAHTD